ncbi:MAG: hypothetical protein IIY01_00415 [Clostridia bacterium]|jgi:hypothetical protein|nr:hypothetical protein [Clostridia bacterium]MBQ5725616.1 hypothetical protein [Clostridia bacterium]
MAEKKTAEKINVGVIPLDPHDLKNKYMLLSVNGKTIMLERGKEAFLTPPFAEAYRHRVEMQKARIRRRQKLADEEAKRAREAGIG